MAEVRAVYGRRIRRGCAAVLAVEPEVASGPAAEVASRGGEMHLQPGLGQAPVAAAADSVSAFEFTDRSLDAIAAAQLAELRRVSLDDG